jgi:hypothetical protein
MPPTAKRPRPNFQPCGTVFLMRLIYSVLFSLFLTAILACGTALAANPPSKSTQGLFTSVTGRVKVTSASGKKTRAAQKDSTVAEGERIVTAKDSKATLRLFDGSELNISPNTDLALTKMQKPSGQDKILQFKLFVGNLLAKVKKLASARSSFEIEAGGVVCGVRGTQYDYSYNPTAHRVTVHVDEGAVYLNANGQKYLFTAGQTASFINGAPGPNNPGQNPKGGNQSNGNKGNGNPYGLGSLADLNQQFEQILAVNPQNTSTDPIPANGSGVLTNPYVEGSLHLNVHVNVPPQETVP